MKTRMGFVSNSSSTSFVIALSRNFTITDKVVSEFIKQHDEYQSKSERGKLKKKNAEKKIQDVIEFACKQSSLYSEEEYQDYDDDDDDDDDDEKEEKEEINIMRDLQTLIRSCPDIVIGSIEGGPDDSRDQCINVLADDSIVKIKKILDQG